MFVQVAQRGSFSRAAAALAVSKSHVSKQIAQLEARLEAQLLVRTTRNVSLTEVGNAFYLRCQDILATLDEAEQAVADLQEKPRGRLRITAAGAFGEEFIAPAAAEFMRANPGLTVELDFSNHLVDLIAHGYDLAIRTGPLKDSSLIARRICNRRLITCASPGYIARHGAPDTVAALVNHKCLVGTLDSWRFRESDRNFDIRVDGDWRSNNGRALIHAALNDLGITQLPDFYAREAVEAGLLVPVLEQYNPNDTGVWAVYPPNRHLSAKVRLFGNFLADRFSAH